MTHKRGDSLKSEYVYKTQDGTPIDITGFSIKCQARVSKSSEETLFDLSIGSGITVTDATAGAYEIQILDTTLWGLTTYLMEFQFTNPVGFVKSSNTIELIVVGDIVR